LEAAVKDLRPKIQSLETECIKLKRQIEDENKSHLYAVDSLKSELNKGNITSLTRAKELADLKCEMVSKSKEIDELKNNLVQKTKQYEDKLGDTTRLMNELRVRLEESKKNSDQANKLGTSLQSSIRKLQEDLQAKNNEISQQSKELESYKVTFSQILQLSRVRVTNEKDFSAIVDIYNDLFSQVKRLTSDLEKLKNVDPALNYNNCIVLSNFKPSHRVIVAPKDGKYSLLSHDPNLYFLAPESEHAFEASHGKPNDGGLIIWCRVVLVSDAFIASESNNPYNLPKGSKYKTVIVEELPYY